MSNIKLKPEPLGVHGVVERRLFDSDKLAEIKRLLSNLTVDDSGTLGTISSEAVARLFDEAAKPQFKWNGIGKLLGVKFGVDLQIPFITGAWTTKAISENLIPTRGKQMVAERLGGTGSALPATAVAIGTGNVGAAAGDTALNAEITTGGGARGAATVTNVTTTTTLDTEQWVRTFTFTAAFAIVEEGLFDNNTSGGVMLARQVFSAVNVANGDSLQVTHRVQVS
jgi:hypothetical protein